MHTPDNRDAELLSQAYSVLLEEAPQAPEFDDLVSIAVLRPSAPPGQGSGRNGLLVGGVAAAAVLLLIGLVPTLLQSSKDVGSESAPSLGVFEPTRGRIVVVNGNQLIGVDPADPRSQAVLDVPELPPIPDEACASWSSGPCDSGAGSLMPIGWSSDGTVLALESEYAGMAYLMDDTATVIRVPREQVGSDGGCCVFAGSNWLSPDGLHAAIPKGLGVAIVELDRMTIESEAQLDPKAFPGVDGFGQIYYPTWSPDAAEVAFVAVGNEDGAEKPSIHVYNRDTKSLRELPDQGFGHIRNLAWSPKGKQLLVIAGDAVLRYSTQNNPLTRSIATSLYLVEIDGGASRGIADGHYVAAAWSPDGSQVATVDRAGLPRLVVMNADGTDQKALIHMNGYGYDNLFTGVTWHPTP